MAENRVGLVYDDLFKEHFMGEGHPERPERLTAIKSHLESAGLWQKLLPHPIRAATVDEITAIHGKDYLDRVAETEGKSHTYLDPDTSTAPLSYEAALKAAGSGVSLTLEVAENNLDHGVALLRPPGHHAEANRAMGFCIFNNVAIAARAAQAEKVAEKVAILDWDVHHGNGTQHSFEDDPSVFYFSVHHAPFYPGTGDVREVGEGRGRGATLNVPQGSGREDGDYNYLMSETILPALNRWKPDLVLVSAGFDQHERDPLGGMSVTTEGLKAIWQVSRECAALTSHGTVVFLEGGYDLRALREGMHAVVDDLLHDRKFEAPAEWAPSSQTVEIVEVVKSLHPLLG